VGAFGCLMKVPSEWTCAEEPRKVPKMLAFPDEGGLPLPELGALRAVRGRSCALLR